MFAWEWIKIKMVLIAAALLGVLVAILKIRQSGKMAERAANLEATIEALRSKERIKNETERMPNGAAAGRLRDDWSRD